MSASHLRPVAHWAARRILHIEVPINLTAPDPTGVGDAHTHKNPIHGAGLIMFRSIGHYGTPQRIAAIQGRQQDIGVSKVDLVQGGTEY